MYLLYRDADEPTGDEPDDADLETPKIYEPVCKLNFTFASYTEKEISCQGQIYL